jgi:hypothetical protein
MTTYRKTSVRRTTAICAIALATVALAGLGSTATSADPQKNLQMNVPKDVLKAIVVNLPCQTKLDYVPNSVGGLYVTNNTGKTIPQLSKLTTVLFIGDKNYPQTKTMSGMWAAGKKLLIRTFIWHPSKPISCTATMP